jgi:TolB-like protein/predicted Ser/Thr protein kinase
MNLAGLTDSIAAIDSSPNECPVCHATSRIAHGLCLSCLLQSGAEHDGPDEPDEFEAALAAVSVADTHWRLGNYEILEEIGRGGMGVIYRARQRHSRRVVALKRVLGYHTDSRETLIRFRREAEAAASLDHPNILPIYDVGESEEGIPYFGMKYAAGGSLQEVGPALRDNRREIIGLLAKVTRAVQYAHRRGILHRDLKPGNILLDGRGEPLVSDFGLAKWLDTSTDLTRTLTVFGTPGFIAPEQAEGPAADLTPAADLYSLGAILFDLLTGRPPFLGEHAIAVIRQAADKPAPKLRSLVRDAGKDLETICARCLERDPSARYRSAGDLAEDLERWLEGRPIIARPVTPPVRVWRWACRNPALAGSIAACLVLGTVAVGRQVQSWRLRAAVEEEARATHSIAVLPFLNLDTASPQEALTQTVADSLRGYLPDLGPARISLVPTTDRYWADTTVSDDIKEANRSINARTVLTGSTRLVNGKTRVSVRLLSAATGDELLTESFVADREASGGMTQLRELARPIYSVLDERDWSRMTIKSRDLGLRNPSAREFIISGRQLMFRDSTADLDRSLRCLEKAIQLEPKSAIAHAYLAATAAGRIHFAWDPQLLARAEKEAKEALALEPRLADGHRALAAVYYQVGRYDAALEEQLRAVETGGPEELVAAFLGATYGKLGHPDRALAWLELARHWASRPGDYDAMIGDRWSELGDDARAEAAYARSRELRPESSEGWTGLCHLRLLGGDLAAARQLCRENSARALRDQPSDTNPDLIAAQIEFFGRNYAEAERIYRDLAAHDASNGAGFYGSVTYDSALGRLQQLTGNETEGNATLEKARSNERASPSGAHTAPVLYCLAAIESSLGQRAQALDHLEAAIAAGWSDASSPRLDPRFDAIAHEPRFENVLSTLTKHLAEMRRQTSQSKNMADNGEAPSPNETKTP